MSPSMVASISWRVDTHREFLGIPYYPHGLLIVVGFVAGSLVLLRYARRLGVDRNTLVDILTWVLAGSLVGTRLLWVLGNPGQIDSPLDVLAVWRGGMTLYGGILGGLVVGVTLLRRHGLPVLALLDYAAPGLTVGLVIGRISDLITGDHLGTPTSLPWGFEYRGDNPPGTAPAIGEIVHPVALYDVVSVSILLGVLVVFLRRPRAVGSAAALFAGWYATTRLLTDFLRTDPTRAFGLTGTQLSSIAVLAVVVGWLVWRARASHGAQATTTPERRAAGTPA